MKRLFAGTIAAVALATGLSTPAMAHRQWLLPSATTFSGSDAWVTVDGAVSNDLFVFEHQALRLPNLKATAPDGTEAKIENLATLRYRSVFDVHLTQQGTYRIGSATDMVNGSYDLNGKTERLPRGTTKENLAAAIPAGATNIRTAESSSRNEVYVTVGEPTTKVFAPSGKGIELVPVTHPTDLVAGEAATFQFLLDGKPAAGLTVTVIPGGIRFRDQLHQIDLKTGADGKVAITWPTAGNYWVNVSTPSNRGEGPGGPGGPGAAAPAAGAAMPAAPAAPRPAPAGPPQRRASYITVVEVLAP